METQATEANEKEMWALVELFGHSRIAGKVSEAGLGGGALIRVEVPAVKDREPLTKYIAVKAIYAITPVTEASARRMAQDINPAPVNEYSIERLVEKAIENRSERGLTRGREEDEDDDEEVSL